jgi:hypothetical protein
MFSMFGSGSVRPRQISRIRLRAVRFELNFENINDSGRQLGDERLNRGKAPSVDKGKQGCDWLVVCPGVVPMSWACDAISVHAMRFIYLGILNDVDINEPRDQGGEDGDSNGRSVMNDVYIS